MNKNLLRWYNFRNQEDVNNFGSERYTEIDGHLIIGELEGGDITYLSSLLGLNYIGNYLVVSFNEHLTNPDGLESLIDISVFLQIVDNSSLTNIDGLKNVERIGHIVIYNNDTLTNLNGLSNTSFIANEINIKQNDSLIDFCARQPFLSNNNYTGIFDVELNEYNPSLEQIINGECSL